MNNGSTWPPPPVEPATVGKPTAASNARGDGVHVDAETERLIANLRQRHIRLLMALRPALLQRPQAEPVEEPGQGAAGGSRAEDANPVAVPVADAPEEMVRPTDAAFDDVVRTPASSSVEVVAQGRVNDAPRPMTEVNRGTPLLVDYKEAAYLLSLCRPKVGDTSPEQAEVRGVNALKQRVASGRLPARCIKRSGRRVQFVRMALVEWASGRGKVRA
jgi:hypothetical protein